MGFRDLLVSFGLLLVSFRDLLVSFGLLLVSFRDLLVNSTVLLVSSCIHSFLCKVPSSSLDKLKGTISSFMMKLNSSPSTSGNDSIKIGPSVSR